MSKPDSAQPQIKVASDLAELQQEVLELRRSEAQFVRIFQQSPICLTISDLETGAFHRVNDTWCQTFGCRPEEAIGKTAVELGLTLPGDNIRERALEILKRDGQVRSFEARLLTRSGRQLTVLFSADVIEFAGAQRVYSTITDITAEVEALRQAAAYQQRFMTAVEHMPVGIALYDENDRLVHWNEHYRSMNEEVVDVAKPGETFESLLRTRIQRNTIHNIGRDIEAWIQARMEKHRNPGDPVELFIGDRTFEVREHKTPDGGTMVIMADMTEQRAAELDLLQAKEEAEFADRAKTEFLANMSHELRTPLNAILGFAQMLKLGVHGSLNKRQAEQLEYVDHSAQHLLDLIGDILDISKIEAGRAELSEESVDIGKTVAVCMNMIRAKADEASITLHTDLPDDVPPLFCDERKVKQILLNLLSNAVKFTKAGGNVWVTVKQVGDGRLRIEVTDDGIGIAPSDMPKAMATFGQVDSVMNRSHPGTGLGLPLARSMCELHGGELEIESQPRVGTTARVWFPAYRLGKMDSQA